MVLPRVVNKSGQALWWCCLPAKTPLARSCFSMKPTQLIAVQRWNGFINPPFIAPMPP
jgi:hypothetical protein